MGSPLRLTGCTAVSVLRAVQGCTPWQLSGHRGVALSDWPREGPGCARTQLLAELSCECALAVPSLRSSFGLFASPRRRACCFSPVLGACLRTAVSVGNQGCLHLRWLDQMNDCRCHQVFSTEFHCLWTNLLFCLSAFVLGTSAIPELKQTFSPET